jgi:RecA-family ATPase
MISPHDPRYEDYLRARAKFFDKQKRDRSSGQRRTEKEIDQEIFEYLDREKRGNGSAPNGGAKTKSPGDDRSYAVHEDEGGANGSAGVGQGAKGPLQENPEQVRPLGTFSAAEFEGVEPPNPRWLVKDRVPMRAVTLLAGDGATGKTTIVLQLSVCVAGRLSGWLNAVVEEYGPTLFFTAEEERDEVHRRLRAITAHHRIPYPPDLHICCATELDPQLAVISRKQLNRLEPTLVYEALRLRIEALRPKLVVLESSADLFGGDEINRAQVRRFIALLRKLARDFDCAVILLSHPSVRGMADDSGTSGNTAWHNTVRARMYFNRVEGSPDLRKLNVKKSNYGPEGETLTVQWIKGVYVPEPQPGSLERQAAEQKINERFLTILRRFTGQGRTVSDKASSTFAPTVFAGEPEAEGTTKDEFRKSMTRLFASNAIRVDLVGPRSKPRSIIVEVPEAESDLFQGKGQGDA